MKERPIYYWHGYPCELLTKPIFKKGVIRNCRIKLLATDELMIVPFRALRKPKG